MQPFTRPRRGAVIVICLLVLSGGTTASQSTSSAVPARPDDRTIGHVLNRLGFGPAPGDLERVRQIGLETYIQQQLHPERLADEGMAPRLADLPTLSLSTRELAERYYLPAQMARRQQQQQREAPEASMTEANRRDMMTPEQREAMQGERRALLELTQQKILRAAYSERQLEEVLVDFWFNHFNVFAGKGQTRQYLIEYEREAIRPHVLGKFRDLLHATAQSPAMLFYLDNWQSAAPEGSATMAAARRAPGGRQGFRRPGANGQPRMPGNTPGVAQNRRPRGLNENYARELMELHTLGVDGGYTQKDVQEVARAFTGWTIDTPRLGGSFIFEPRMHDDGEKIVLGHRIKAGGGRSDGEQVLDLLARHPSTARHIATKLARRFVADDPPAALVERAAKRFRETDGDIRDVVRTIVTSKEFFAPEAYRAKIKSPFEFVVSAVRATKTELATAAPLVAALRDLGMPLYMCQPPTGYADKADAWVNTGALLNRMNFAVALTGGRARGAAGPLRGGPAAAVSSDVIVKAVLAGDISDATTATVAKAENGPQAVALVLGSPDFQKR